MSDQAALVASLQSKVARQRDELKKMTQLREDKALLTRDVAALRSALAASQVEVARLREVLAAVVFEASCVECATDRESTGTFRMALDRARAAMQGETP